jgi:hypothetical protein
MRRIVGSPEHTQRKKLSKTLDRPSKTTSSLPQREVFVSKIFVNPKLHKNPAPLPFSSDILIKIRTEKPHRMLQGVGTLRETLPSDRLKYDMRNLIIDIRPACI